MKINRILIPMAVGFVLIFGSCDSSLWYGGNGGAADLTLRLELPYPEQSPGAGRALALQGLHIYIEIADIQDESLYSDDPDHGLTIISEGDGTWKEMPWGGHAVFHAAAFGTQAITVSFNDVPTDRDLLIRVIQDTDRAAVESAMSGYGEVYPLTQTFVPAGTGPWADLGTTLTSGQLSSGQVRVPIRPHSNRVYYYAANPTSSRLRFSDFVLPATNPSQEPPSGETRFTAFSLSMAGDTTVNPGMLVGYQIEQTEGLPVPGVVAAYSSSGSPVPPSRVHSTTTDGITTISSYSIFPAPPDDSADYTNYFIGSTLIPGVDLSGANPDYPLFDVVIRPMTGSYFESDYGDIGSGVITYHLVRWGWPDTDGVSLFEHGDLEFQVLHWYGTDNVPAVFKDIDFINNLNPIVVMNWSTAGSFYSPGDGWEYEMTDIASLPGLNINPQNGDNYITVVLARVPGGIPFIIAGLSSFYDIPVV